MANARYARVTLGLDFATDVGRTQKTLFRDKSLDAQMTIDSHDSGSVAVSSTKSVNFGAVTTAKALYIEAEGALEVRINGAGSGPTLGALTLAKQDGATTTRARWYLEGTFTSLSLVNASSTAVVPYLVYVCGS